MPHSNDTAASAPSAAHAHLPLRAAAWGGPALAGAGGLLLGLAQTAADALLPALAGLLLGTAGGLLAMRQGRLAATTALGLGLAGWQLQALGWLAQALPPAQRSLAPALQALGLALNLLVLLPLLALLGALLRRALPTADALQRAALAWPLAWWGWQLARDASWWGGGYGSLALALLDWPVFAVLLPLCGAALSEALVVGAAAASLLLLRGAWRRAGLRGLLAGLLTLIALLLLGQTLPAAQADVQRELTVTALPAPAEREPAWSLAQRDAALLALHRALATAAPGRLVVSSEGYLGEPPPQQPQGVWADLLQVVEAGAHHLLLGLPMAVRGNDGPGLLNGVLQLSSTPDGGLRAAFYAKQRLAPGGEALPWPQLFAPLLRRLGVEPAAAHVSAGPAALDQALFVAGEGVALNLCHELAHGGALARQSLQAGWLLNMAYDAWLPAPGYRLQVQRLARLRAMELGKALLRVSQGSGVLLVDADGRLLAEGPSGQALTMSLPIRDQASPYARWAGLQLPAALLLGALLLVAAAHARFQRSRR